MKRTATAFALDPVKVSTAAGMAKVTLRFRQRRAKRLGGDLFSDPAWDILLILTSESGSGKPCTLQFIADAIGSPISPATIERWLVILIERGFVMKDEGSARGAPAYALSLPGFEALNSLIG